MAATSPATSPPNTTTRLSVGQEQNLNQLVIEGILLIRLGHVLIINPVFSDMMVY